MLPSGPTTGWTGPEPPAVPRNSVTMLPTPTTTLAGAEQPNASVTVTVYVLALLTVMDCVVSPVDQTQEAPAFAVSVKLPPTGITTGPGGVMLAIGVSTTNVVRAVA